MKRSIVIVLLSIFACVIAHGGHDDAPANYDASDVVILTTKNFDDIVNNEELILVKFFAPWCGHCKKIAPEYAKAATQLKNDDPPIKLAEVDATVESELGTRFSISGYPTLKLFRNGQASDYNGPREAAGIVEYMRKQSGPAVRLLENADALKKFTGLSSYSVVGFFSDNAERRQMYASFVITAEKLRDKHRFGKVYEAELFTKYNLTRGLDYILAFKDFDDKLTVYQGDSRTKNLEAFINENSIPLLSEMTEDKMQNIMERKLPVLKLFLHVDWNSPKAMNFYLNPLKDLAIEYRGKIIFGYSDISKSTREMESLGANTLTPPTLMIIDGPRKKYHMEGTFRKSAVRTFLEDYEKGKLRLFTKSEPLPEDPKDGDVTVVVGTTFKEIVQDPSKDVFIEFYAPWCGHCKQLAPKYQQLAKKLRNAPNLVIAKIDATANDYSPEYDVHGFPSIFFKPAGKDSKPIQFNGEREVSGMMKFIRENAKMPLEGKKKKKRNTN